MRAAKDFIKHWSDLKWRLQVVNIEQDFLQGGRFQALLLKTQHVNEVDSSGPTSSSIAAVDGKALRTACQNASVITQMLLEEPQYRSLMAIMVHSLWPIVESQGMQNADCRDVLGSTR